MQAMLDNVTPRLQTGAKMLLETIEAGQLPEGLYAADLSAIADTYPNASIGSYPSFATGAFRNQIVVRSKEQGVLEAACADVRAMVERLTAARAAKA